MKHKQNSSIIGDNGSIQLTIPAGEVTWYSVLSATRAANSIEGGWNNKSGWEQYGLGALVDEHGSARDFVRLWTKNSLAPEADPLPRRNGFQLGLRRDALVRQVRGASGTPDARTENAINWNLSRRLFASAASGQRQVTYELPLADDAEGQLKADIVVFHDTNRLEIVELKRKPPCDTPLMALVEAVCYALQAVRCWKALQGELRHNAPDKAPSHIHLILGGPGIWAACNPDGAISAEQCRRMRSVIAEVEAGLKESGYSTSLTLTLADITEDGSGVTLEGDSQPVSWSVIVPQV